MFANYDPHPVARALLPQRTRKTLRGPDYAIAVRNEHIAERKTNLILWPQGDARSATAYKITDEDYITYFTVSGRKYSDRSCREFRDDSGLPMFELHRKISLRNPWYVTLPGSDAGSGGSIATAAFRFPQGLHMLGNFGFSFENAAAVDTKREDDKRVSLQIERHGNILVTFDVVYGDRKVAEIRESIPHNKTLPLASSRAGYRPVLDITIVPGMDIALAVIIAVIASDLVFTANN